MATLTATEVEILTTEQAAEIIGVSEIRVRQFCQEGRLGKKFGDRWVITAKEAREFSGKQRPSGRPKKSQK